MLRTSLEQLKNALRRPMSGGAWLSEVDGLRFIAIFTVALQHLMERFAHRTPIEVPEPYINDQFAFFISRGTVGVFLFFAISGFVLALPFAKHHLRGGPPVPLSQFYWRRVTRIEPPYLAWMTLFALVLLAKGDFSLSQILPHWLTSITYTHGLFYEGHYSPINPVAWSLEIEIQFYILAPFLSAAYFSIRNQSDRRLLLLSLIFGWLVLQSHYGWWFFPMRTSLAGQFQHFLVGFLVADLYLTNWKDGARQHYIWDLLGPLAYVVMCYTWTTEFEKNVAFTIALGVLFVSAFKGVWFRKLLQNHWIAVFGGMCYTIYLMHLPLLEALTLFTTKLTFTDILWVNFLLQCLICLPIVAALSAAFYLLLEKPFMRKRAPGEPFISFPKLSLSSIYKKTPAVVVPEKTARNAAGGGLGAGLLLFAFLPASALAQQEQPAMAAAPPQSSSQANAPAAAPAFAPPEADSTLWSDSLKLRPLADLVAEAIAASPDLKGNRVDVAKQALMLQIQKRSWADQIGFTVGGAYGNGLSTEAKVVDANVVTVSSGRLTTTVNMGLSLRVTGGDFLTRRQKAQVQRLQLDNLKIEREGLELLIQQKVTALFYQIELALAIVDLKAESVENVRLALDISEKYFREGQLPPESYSTMLSKMTGAKEDYLKAKMEAKKLALEMQALTGGRSCWQKKSG